MTQESRIETSLVLLRLGVFVVMFMWTLDKFVRPEHAGAVYEKFYGLAGMGPSALYALAAVEMLILLGFLIGIAKRLTYGAVLLFHAVSTLSSYKQYLAPFAEGPNLLFFAAWPMLAACIALYLMRDQDDLWSLGRPSR